MSLNSLVDGNDRKNKNEKVNRLVLILSFSTLSEHSKHFLTISLIHPFNKVLYVRLWFGLWGPGS